MSKDWPAPRTKLRKGNYPYLYTLNEDITQETSWQLAQPFDSQWLHISTKGSITVKAGKAGYAWDGCSPKFSFLNLAILGTPDGHVDYRTGKPYTYKASLFHDALYQYLDTVPVPKAEVDRLFYQMLGDFTLAKVYYLAVRLFGGIQVKQNGLEGWLGHRAETCTTPDLRT